MFQFTKKPSSGSHNQYLAVHCVSVYCILYSIRLHIAQHTCHTGHIMPP